MGLGEMYAACGVPAKIRFREGERERMEWMRSRSFAQLKVCDSGRARGEKKLGSFVRAGAGGVGLLRS